MSCFKLSEKNEIDKNELEEYDEETMVPEHLTEELKKFENQENTNLEETETVNLGDDESVRETRFGVYLT